MSASIEDQLRSALSPFFGAEWFGRQVIYNGSAVSAIFRPTANPDKARAGSAATAELQISTAALPTWAVNDVVDVDGEAWQVKRAAAGSTQLKHVLELERDRRLKP
jgi:hypothetical protein